MSNNNEINLFVHSSLFIGYSGKAVLRDYLEKSEPVHNSTIMDVSEKNLVILEQTTAHQNLSLSDTAFEFLVKQKISDGYIYSSVDSLKKLVELY